MPNQTCAVLGCSNHTSRLRRWRKEHCDVHRCAHWLPQCNCLPPFRHFPFPRKSRDPTNRDIWIKNVNRIETVNRTCNTGKLTSVHIQGEQWFPELWDRVCSRHFVDGEPTEANPYPTLHMGPDNNVVITAVMINSPEKNSDNLITENCVQDKDLANTLSTSKNITQGRKRKLSQTSSSHNDQKITSINIRDELLKQFEPSESGHLVMDSSVNGDVCEQGVPDESEDDQLLGTLLYVDNDVTPPKLKSVQPFFSTTPTLEDMRVDLAEFVQERHWEKHHTPRNILAAITGEVDQLSQLFQTKSDVHHALPTWTRGDREHLEHTLSDIQLYLVRLADRCAVNLPAAVAHKMQHNRHKYPPPHT